MAIWPRPERLLPPRLLDALDAARAGDAPRALELCAGTDARDPLAGGIVRLVRGLVALEGGDGRRGRADLRPLCRDSDPAVALVATLAVADHLLLRRRHAEALALLARLPERLEDPGARLWIEATRLAGVLQRIGRLDAERVAALERRLDRRHPPSVHAAVHLLAAERALLASELGACVAAHRKAQPHVRSAGIASLRRRHQALATALGTPFADVEDWRDPRRTVSRDDLAALESEPWQAWFDVLHRCVRRRARRGAEPGILTLGAAPEIWETLEALLRTSRHQLAWGRARDLLHAADPGAVRARAERLAAELRKIDLPLAVTSVGFALRVERFVTAFPVGALPELDLRLLGLLATSPGAAASDLATASGAARRTVVEHLLRLRRTGYVRLVGGGREARYTLI